jgi:hypothetical protein
MKTLVLFVVCALLAGCGSDGYVSPEEYKLRADRALTITVGRVMPSIQDYIDLDINNDGSINIADTVILLQLAMQVGPK